MAPNRSMALVKSHPHVAIATAPRFQLKGVRSLASNSSDESIGIDYTATSKSQDGQVAGPALLVADKQLPSASSTADTPATGTTKSPRRGRWAWAGSSGVTLRAFGRCRARRRGHHPSPILCSLCSLCHHPGLAPPPQSHYGMPAGMVSFYFSLLCDMWYYNHVCGMYVRMLWQHLHNPRRPDRGSRNSHVGYHLPYSSGRLLRLGQAEA